MLGADGLGVELDAHQRQRLMLHGHNQPIGVCCARGDSEAAGQRGLVYHKRMVTHNGKGRWDAFKQAAGARFFCVLHRREPPMHRERCSNDESTKGHSKPLHAKAHAEDGEATVICLRAQPKILRAVWFARSGETPQSRSTRGV